ncbi:amidase [Nocardioides sp. URHA0032]|uniref:amidase n=1 Tax=Nocardioides sp. URHA0032 TaxID=1380388 RepID=UPI00048F114B|nr:amidase [Nocardioides sp. URHA0032]
MIDVVEASIAEVRAALESGAATAVEVVGSYLARIDRYDGAGTATALNSVVVRAPDALAQAAASDARRKAGAVLGPLDGIPYVAKDSYLVAGMTAAAGSPAFADVVAQHDAFTISRLRGAGAICLGKTNMPPMANGGMQRGLYGRSESPYNPDFLAAPYASGSSHGSAVALTSSFATFAMAEETWSSGRGPASNNALCAYTPSRGLISVRGIWPLTPSMDVAVPYARTMADLLEVLDVLVADDPDPSGDLWRLQNWIPLPAPRDVRPASYLSLQEGPDSLTGFRLGVPRMYVNADLDAGTGTGPSLGGPTGKPIRTRDSIIDLWREARRDLEAAGAVVADVDFPVVANYESDRPGGAMIDTRGLVPSAYREHEDTELTAWALDDFLRSKGDPRLHRLVDVDPSLIQPDEPGTLPGREGDDLGADLADSVDIAERGITPWSRIPTMEDGLRGLEETRRIDLEDWMATHGLDAIVFPAVADVGPADMDRDPYAADLGWRNGVWVANGNLVIRHLGIPTVTVPMGTMSDIGMPVGLTFAGRSYSDDLLLRLASAFEATRTRRTPPPRTPRLG